MKKFVVPALAALALAACADSTPDNTDAMATAEGDAAMMAPAPAATESPPDPAPMTQISVLIRSI